MTTLTIFANFFINNEESFIRMKDSFNSFKDIKADKRVINVRWQYKLDTLFFLHDNLGKKLVAYLMESKKWWFHDTRQILKDINTDYVFFWIEDHINLVDTSKYDEILHEMKENNVDELFYSFYHFWRCAKTFANVNKNECKNINVISLNKENNVIAQKEKEFYIISAVSFFKTDFFKKIISKNDPILRRRPKQTPFDFEKWPRDIHWLPFTFAYPKYELFASIDDNNTYDWYSLQARWLYPIRKDRKEMKNENKLKIILRNYLPKPILNLIKFFVRIWYHI